MVNLDYLSTASLSHNEQFFQVGLLDRALISLGLALSPPSTLTAQSPALEVAGCFTLVVVQASNDDAIQLTYLALQSTPPT